MDAPGGAVVICTDTVAGPADRSGTLMLRLRATFTSTTIISMERAMPTAMPIQSAFFHGIGGAAIAGAGAGICEAESSPCGMVGGADWIVGGPEDDSGRWFPGRVVADDDHLRRFARLITS